MAIYALLLYTAGFLAPVFSGFIDDAQGWRWVQVRKPGKSCLESRAMHQARQMEMGMQIKASF